MFLSYFEWNEAKEGSVFYILYQYIIFVRHQIFRRPDQARHSVLKQSFITSWTIAMTRSTSYKRPVASIFTKQFDNLVDKNISLDF